MTPCWKHLEACGNYDMVSHYNWKRNAWLKNKHNFFVCSKTHSIFLLVVVDSNDSGHHNLGSFQKFCRRDLMFRWSSYKNMLLVECCKVGTHTKGHTYLGHVLNLQEQSWAPSDNCTWEIIFLSVGCLVSQVVCYMTGSTFQ